MLTYRLWQWIAHPPNRHPLYRRVVLPRLAPEWWRLILRGLGPLAPLGYLVALVFVCCSATSLAFGGFVVAAALAVILFNATVFSLSWASLIAAELSRERESGAWDLFCLLPEGGLGAAWAAATGCLHRHSVFRRRYRRQLYILRALLILMVVVVLGWVLNPRRIFEPELLIFACYGLLIVVMPYLDFVQSTVLATLVGIYVGTRAHNRADVQIWSVTLFLTLQAAVYLLAVIVGFYLLPAVFQWLAIETLPAELLLLVLRFALFIGVREAVIAALWRIVALQLNTTRSQLDTLRQPG